MTTPDLCCVVANAGLRGIVSDTIAVPEVLGLAAAFGFMVAKCGPVVLGRDSWLNGAMFAQAAGLRCARSISAT